jgi:hypothetical protein
LLKMRLKRHETALGLCGPVCCLVHWKSSRSETRFGRSGAGAVEHAGDVLATLSGNVDAEARQAINKVDGVSVHLLRFADTLAEDPVLRSEIRDAYHLRGWKRVISAGEGGAIHDDSTDVGGDGRGESAWSCGSDGECEKHYACDCSRQLEPCGPAASAPAFRLSVIRWGSTEPRTIAFAGRVATSEFGMVAS